MTPLVLWLLVSAVSAASRGSEIPNTVTADPASRIPHPASTQPAVRFHHVHYRVGDPSAAINHAAVRMNGTRVIVSGIGVGVRAGTEYLIFDRLDETDPLGIDQVPVADAYRAAVAWLARHGITAAPAEATSPLLTALPGERYDHLAFAATDLPRLAQQLSDAGVVAVHRTADGMLVDAGNGLRVELVGETVREDAFWCPMHPDVRSPDAGSCYLCGMELVPIPAPKVGEYKLDVTQIRPPTGPGLSGLTFRVHDPDSNGVVKDFIPLHERLFHLFIIGRDLEYFQHVHPVAAADGIFVLTQAIPPGEYMLIGDFLPQGGTTQMVQRALIVGGVSRPRPPAVASTDVRITMAAEDFAAGKYACLTFTVSDAKTGTPVTDLEAYLGAPAHMLLVRADLTDAVHAHPEEIGTAGPVISFHPLVPAAGDYKLWVQVQRAGKVITVPFSLRAER
jgi:hypothetical protein